MIKMKKINLVGIKAENDKRIAQSWNDYDLSFLPVLNYSIEIREEQEIKIRAFILAIIVQVSFDIVKPNEALDYISSNNLEVFLTENERWFFENAIEEDKINETWKSECVFTLLWALSVVDNLKDYSSSCDMDANKEGYPFFNTNTYADKFLNRSAFKIRSEFELIEMLDLYSRLDYICDWCKINNIKCPFDSAIIYERRYALMWLTQRLDWDSVECNSIY